MYDTDICNNCLCVEVCEIVGNYPVDDCDYFKNKADFVKLSEVKKVIMDYIFEQTVSKYPSAELCRASRMGAEGVIYALEDAFEGGKVMTDDIIQEATEAYEQGRDAGYAVGELLRIIKNQKVEIDIIIRKKKTLRDEIAEKDAKIEMLKNAYKQCAWERDLFAEDIGAIKSVAYKEIAEAVKKKLGVEKFSLIDNIAKELTEGKK